MASRSSKKTRASASAGFGPWKQFFLAVVVGAALVLGLALFQVPQAQDGLKLLLGDFAAKLR